MDEPAAATASFTYSYPVWICVRADNPSLLMGGTLEGGGKFVAVFTEAGLAGNFIAARGLQGQAGIVGIRNRAEFAAGLEDLRKAGFSHVVFNNDGKGGVVQLAFEIGSLLRVIEESFQ